MITLAVIPSPSSERSEEAGKESDFSAEFALSGFASLSMAKGEGPVIAERR